MSQTKKKSWIFPTILGLLLFAVCLYLTELPDLAAISGFNRIWLTLAILAQGGFAIPMPWRWKIVSAGANVFIPYFPAFKITAYTSLAAALVPQSLADLAGRGPWEARYTNTGLLNATNIILCDRLLDIFIIGLFFPPAILLTTNMIDNNCAIWLGAGVAFLGILILFLLRDKFFLLFELLFRFIHSIFNHISFLKGKFNWHVSPISLSLKNLCIVYILSTFKFFVMACATYAYFKVVNLELPLALIFFSLPVTQFIFIFAFTPGGLGVFELGWAGILAMHGLASGDIALFIISQRICFTLGVIFWGLVAFAMYRINLSPPPSQSNREAND